VVRIGIDERVLRVKPVDPLVLEKLLAGVAEG